jgi:transcription-repair coupling factor (superfamily II helicase)
MLYPPEVPLTETAYDRLATIAQNNELGAGMAVAMKDLEIRGAGNVLGAEQSGHVAGVGFDLYVRLVGEAVEAYRAVVDGETVAAVEEPKEVRIDLPVDAHLPPDYIGSDRLRLEGYRRLAAASDDAGITSVIEELVDRYGPLPEPAERLVALARLRLLCRQYGVTEVTAVSEANVRISPLPLMDSQQLGSTHVPERYLPRDHVDRGDADPRRARASARPHPVANWSASWPARTWQQLSNLKPMLI